MQFVGIVEAANYPEMHTSQIAAHKIVCFLLLLFFYIFSMYVFLHTMFFRRRLVLPYFYEAPTVYIKFF